jgi:hypothetical protein
MDRVVRIHDGLLLDKFSVRENGIGTQTRFPKALGLIETANFFSNLIL